MDTAHRIFPCLILNVICKISAVGAASYEPFYSAFELRQRLLSQPFSTLLRSTRRGACVVYRSKNLSQPPKGLCFLTKIKHFAPFDLIFPCQSFLFYKKLVPLHRYITKYNWLFCKSAKTQRLLRRRHLIVKGHTCTTAFCVTFHPKLTKLRFFREMMLCASVIELLNRRFAAFELWTFNGT